MNEATIEIAPDKKSLFEKTARMIAEAAKSAIARQGRFALVLTGGSTPRSLYELLASKDWRDRIEWGKVHLFWGDERFVPATDSQSNYGMAHKAMIEHLQIPAANIHRFETENTTPEICANRYAENIRDFFKSAPGVFPSFDFVLNGLGSNRHVLSLFPGRPTIHETSKLVVADYIPEVHMDRVTMTAPLVNAGQEVVFLVAGSDKAEAVNDVINGVEDVDKKPAQTIRPLNGNLTWMLDREAASKLPQK